MQCKQAHELLALTFNISTNHISLYQNLDCFGIYVLFSKEHLSHTLTKAITYLHLFLDLVFLPLRFFFYICKNCVSHCWIFSIILMKIGISENSPWFKNIIYITYFTYRKNSSMIFITIHFNHESLSSYFNYQSSSWFLKHKIFTLKCLNNDRIRARYPSHNNSKIQFK